MALAFSLAGLSVQAQPEKESATAVILSPGVTWTGNGPGAELSVNYLYYYTGFGAVAQYEPNHSLRNIGAQFGFLYLLIEAGVSYSDRGSSVYFAPDIMLPLSIFEIGEVTPMLNVFYRHYPASEYQGLSSLGVSGKFPFRL
jgi:hypothetical protein